MKMEDSGTDVKFNPLQFHFAAAAAAAAAAASGATAGVGGPEDLDGAKPSPVRPTPLTATAHGQLPSLPPRMLTHEFWYVNNVVYLFFIIRGSGRHSIHFLYVFLAFEKNCRSNHKLVKRQTVICVGIRIPTQWAYMNCS